MAKRRPAGGQRPIGKATTPELTDDEQRIYNKLLPLFSDPLATEPAGPVRRCNGGAQAAITGAG